MTKQPVIFLPHGGGPCFFMDWNPPHLWDNMATYLRNIPNLLAERPKSILVISAHWEERDFTVMTNPSPSLFYDYYGFPPHTYQIPYPASGCPELAERVTSLLTEKNITCTQDDKRGFDHGVFIPLKLAFPDANIPITQLSLKKGLSPSEHIRLGRILAPLRDEGVLIIGSGMSYHNLPAFFEHENPQIAKDSQAFDQWLTETIENTSPLVRNKNLETWNLAPSARAAHPREEHLIPLMVISGAAEDSKGRRNYTEILGSIALSGYIFS